jgi:hypothetical protein
MYGLTREQAYVIRFYGLKYDLLLQLNEKKNNGKIAKSYGSIIVGTNKDRNIQIYLKPNGFFSDNADPSVVGSKNYDVITDSDKNGTYVDFYNFSNNNNIYDGYIFKKLTDASWYIPWYNIKQYNEKRQVPLAWYFPYLLKHIDFAKYKTNFPFGL